MPPSETVVKRTVKLSLLSLRSLTGNRKKKLHRREIRRIDESYKIFGYNFITALNNILIHRAENVVKRNCIIIILLWKFRS